jgi:hypothetical protein
MTDLAHVRPERFFADRFSVTPSLMERLLGSALRGTVDDADVYLEYRINEELVLEEGQVKKASRHVSQGAGRKFQLVVGGCDRRGGGISAALPYRRSLVPTPRLL